MLSGMIDYHIHTARCGHAVGEMRDYVERAIELSLIEIGFADHLPLLTGHDPSLTMSMDELEGYVNEVESFKSEFSEISIKLGIEADYLPGREEETARLLGAYDFDYVIGSVHFINGWGFDDSRYIEGYKERSIDEIYRSYYRLVTDAASSGLFDVIGHLDLVKKYNFKTEGGSLPFAMEAVEAIRAAGVCIEINTAGLRKPVGEIYPSAEILGICREAGIGITFGSDAHAPAEVGAAFDQAFKLAVAVGYEQSAVFTHRKRDFIKPAR
jgi:histidinol-phosphatase (PHP family)